MSKYSRVMDKLNDRMIVVPTLTNYIQILPWDLIFQLIELRNPGQEKYGGVVQTNKKPWSNR
jgi:hypothetical protein